MGVDTVIRVKMPYTLANTDLTSIAAELMADCSGFGFLVSRRAGVTQSLVVCTDDDLYDTPKARDGGCIFEVSTTERFWSPDYPRGDRACIRQVCEWLVREFPAGTVYYRSDHDNTLPKWEEVKGTF